MNELISPVTAVVDRKKERLEEEAGDELGLRFDYR